jgi:hypothetical protein
MNVWEDAQLDFPSEVCECKHSLPHPWPTWKMWGSVGSILAREPSYAAGGRAEGDTSLKSAAQQTLSWAEILFLGVYFRETCVSACSEISEGICVAQTVIVETWEQCECSWWGWRMTHVQCCLITEYCTAPHWFIHLRNSNDLSAVCQVLFSVQDKFF